MAGNEALTTHQVSGFSDLVSSWSALFGFNFFGAIIATGLL